MEIFKQLKTFSATYFKILWPYIKPAVSVSDSATTDINQAYLAIKLWLMIARQTGDTRRGEQTYDMVWNELWPPFEGIINVLETEVQNGVSPVCRRYFSRQLQGFTHFLPDHGRVHSIFDHGFIFIHQGAADTSQPPRIGAESYTQTITEFSSRRVGLSQGESTRCPSFRVYSQYCQINRAIESLTEVTPETPVEILIDQAAKDIIATEKLQLLETKREPVRAAGDRRGNVEKKTTVDRLNWKDVRLYT